jgi:hypothetical protein
MRIGTRSVRGRWLALASLVAAAAAVGILVLLGQPDSASRATPKAAAPVVTSTDAAVVETQVYDESGRLLGAYGLDDVDCENISIGGSVAEGLYSTTEGNHEETYARRVSSGHWRFAVVMPGFPNLGTIRRVGTRWQVRDDKGRMVGSTRGPDAVEAALAYATWGASCVTR